MIQTNEPDNNYLGNYFIRPCVQKNIVLLNQQPSSIHNSNKPRFGDILHANL
jgi:hypothetical protein